jgi:hypothetical protein
MKMKPKIKKLWLKALRSGEYEQGTGALRDLSFYCCLGVLCDLGAKAGLGAWADDTDGDLEFIAFHDKMPAKGGSIPDTSETSLTLAVMEWAGLDGNDPEVTIKAGPEEGEVDRNEALSCLNDGNYTFKQIADLIEKSL